MDVPKGHAFSKKEHKKIYTYQKTKKKQKKNEEFVYLMVLTREKKKKKKKKERERPPYVRLCSWRKMKDDGRVKGLPETPIPYASHRKNKSESAKGDDFFTFYGRTPLRQTRINETSIEHIKKWHCCVTHRQC